MKYKYLTAIVNSCIQLLFKNCIPKFQLYSKNLVQKQRALLKLLKTNNLRIKQLLCDLCTKTIKYYGIRVFPSHFHCLIIKFSIILKRILCADQKCSTNPPHSGSYLYHSVTRHGSWFLRVEQIVFSTRILKQFCKIVKLINYITT